MWLIEFVCIQVVSHVPLREVETDTTLKRYISLWYMLDSATHAKQEQRHQQPRRQPSLTPTSLPTKRTLPLPPLPPPPAPLPIRVHPRLQIRRRHRLARVQLRQDPRELPHQLRRSQGRFFVRLERTRQQTDRNVARFVRQVDPVGLDGARGQGVQEVDEVG